MASRRLVAVLVCVAVACTNDAREPAAPRGVAPEPRPGGRVVFGVVGAPATLDPYAPTASDLTRALTRPLFPSLFRLLPNGDVRPALAASLTRRGEVVHVRLRAGRWSDGRRIRASDVVASWRRARAPSGFAAFSSVRGAGARRLVLRGRVADPERALATAAPVLPGGSFRPESPVSAAPFRMRAYRKGFGFTLVANRRGRKRAFLERIDVRFVESVRQLVFLLEDGRIDVAALPSFVNVRDVVDPQLRVLETAGWETVILDFRGSRLPAPARVAIADAIDRRALEEAFIRDAGGVAPRLPLALGRGAQPASTWTGGKSPRRRVQIAVPAGDELLELLQEALFLQLRAAGIDADLVPVDHETLYGPWQVTSPTDAVLRRAMAAPAYGAPTSAPLELDTFPLFEVATFVAAWPEVRGVAPNPTLEGPLWNIERWWLARD